MDAQDDTTIQDETVVPLQRAPDAPEARAAIEAFLKAMGASPVHPQLKDTPDRVTSCWMEHLLNGYQESPEALLGDLYPLDQEASSSSGPVVIRDIYLQGMCPHHLLPFMGKAHVAYIPGKFIVGFSKISELVACLSRRLTLQETITQQVTESLMTHLQAQGAGCVIEAQHTCMTLRAAEHHKSQITTSAFMGTMADQPVWQNLLLSR